MTQTDTPMTQTDTQEGMMRLGILVVLLLVLSGCTGEPLLAPMIAAETLSAEQTQNFQTIMQASQQKGCMKSEGTLSIYGQSGRWEKVSCYGVSAETEAPYLDILKTQ